MKQIYGKIINKILRRFNLILLSLNRYQNDIGLLYDLKLKDYYNEIKRFFSNEPIVFDIGAHVGETAVFYNDIFENSKIHSFEPNKKFFYKLKENVKLLNQKNKNKFIPHNIALGNHVEKKKYYEYSNPVLSGFYKIDDKISSDIKKSSDLVYKFTMITETGDIFCKRNNIKNIDFLKINVQGYEPEIITGFSQMLKDKKIKFILAEFDYSGRYEKKVKISDLENLLSNYEYEFFDFLFLRKRKQDKIKITYGYIIFTNNIINQSSNWK